MIFLLTFASCGRASDRFEAMLDSTLEGSVPQITTEELAAELGESDGLILLDAREREEFEVSHLNGSRWIGFDDFVPERVEDLDRTKPVVIYCSIGKRSEILGEQLADLGFTKVRNLRGGIFDWANQDLPLVTNSDDEERKTNAVHPFNRWWGRWLSSKITKAYEKE